MYKRQLQNYFEKNIPDLKISSLAEKIEEAVQEGNIEFGEYALIKMCIRDRENAVRYALKSIALQIKKKDGLLIISVEDDGIGFVAVSYTHLMKKLRKHFENLNYTKN